jgi:hypothetical protein
LVRLASSVAVAVAVAVPQGNAADDCDRHYDASCNVNSLAAHKFISVTGKNSLAKLSLPF